MPDLLFARCTDRILACAICLGVAALAADVLAQGVPQPQPQAPVPIRCARDLRRSLQASIAAVPIPREADQIRRYEDAAGRQQAELERVTAQAKRMGCDSSGFFSLFNGQSAQCGPVNNQIQRMRTNLEQMTTNLERLRSGNGAQPRARQSAPLGVAGAGAEQLRPAICRAARNSGRLLRQPVRQRQRRQQTFPFRRSISGVQSGTYRTVCVRSATAFTSRSRSPPFRAGFPMTSAPARTLPCSARRSVHLSQSRRGYEPGGLDQRAALFLVAERVSLPSGVQSVVLLQAAGETWAEALKNSTTRPRPQQGDIIVTEENAKKMATAARRCSGKKGNAPASAAGRSRC